MLRLLPFDDGQGGRVGLLRGTSQLLDLKQVAPKTPDTLDRILDGGPYFWDGLAEHSRATPEPGQLLELDDIVATPLMEAPRRTVALDDQPTQVLSIAAPDTEIETTAPDHISGVAAVVRRRCTDLTREEALDAIAGFTVVSGLLQPGHDDRLIVAAQLGPLVLTEGLSPEKLLIRTFLDDMPVETLQTEGAGWEDRIVAASSELLRPRDLILLCGERRNLQAPTEVRVSMAAAGHSVGRLQMRLTPRQ